jgi:two-component system CheB/CheR fusion protein
VLVVDDNTDTAASLGWLLEAFGHEAAVAHTGAAALDAARATRPDAIVLDLGLPDLEGLEVARRLRALPEFRHTLLIASTGFNQERDRLRARDAGFDHYLVKPFDPNRLDEVLRAAWAEAVPA